MDFPFGGATAFTTLVAVLVLGSKVFSSQDLRLLLPAQPYTQIVLTYAKLRHGGLTPRGGPQWLR